MKIVPLFLLFCCTFGGSGMLLAQSDYRSESAPPIYNSLLRVTTDNGTFKGRLIGMTDSSISLLRMKEKDRIDIAATDIGTIKIKRRFFRSVLIDFALGTVLTSVLVISYYWNGGFDNPDDPPFGQALLAGMAIGGGGGILYGMAESTFFKIRIPVNKSLDMFRQHRSRLLKYWAD